MHRHGYSGRKLQREAGPRRALVRGLVTSLVLHEQIVTTEAKAKEAAPYFERLVTKAKKGGLHQRRQIRAFLLTDKATEKMVQVLAPVFADRNGGYTRVVKLGNRQGDNAPMAALMLTEKPSSASDKAETSAAASKPAPSQTPVKPKAVKAKTPAGTQTAGKTTKSTAKAGA